MQIEAPLAEALEWLFRTRAPTTVDTKARELVLDTLGCVQAARRHPEVIAFAKQLQATDAGSASSVAALFASAACWDEACEGLARAHGRPGVAVLAACSALAGANAFSLYQVLVAYVTGYEIAGRLGITLRIAPGMHVDGTWPSFGVAAAVVRLLGGNAEQALAAVRIVACQMPHSLYLPVAEGANARNTYLPHAAQLGMLAANAALAGFVAPAGALEELRKRALANVRSGTPIAPPGEWLILESYLKPYAAVRHVHYGAAAALTLRKKIGDRLRQIRGIELSTYAEALAYCGNRAPQSAIQAQFSLSYGVACALLTGELGPDSYSMKDPEILQIEKKIILSEDLELTRRGKRGATLSIELENEKLENSIEHVTGDPEQPMTRDQILAKFTRYTGQDGVRLLDAPGETRFSEFSPL